MALILFEINIIKCIKYIAHAWNNEFDNDEITTEMLSNEEILKAVLPNNQEKEIEESLNPLPLITHSEVDNKVILYLEQQESDLI
ncbi:uncharacterized protein OCT59_024806 [Rhizophagus irregularis]|uniref:uncharacterized protein n=1 Tax=Rhizophagus irregularis TaxID=588596 RepID=UPI0033340B0C|nr:hypothetical protein OCT59_024806 [Rhizophagus irregularis]